MRTLSVVALVCLAAAARAGTIYTETVDFSDNPATPFILPGGTSQVDGNIGGTDDGDFFEFTGLLGGSSISLIVQNLETSMIGVEILNDAQKVLAGPVDLSEIPLQVFNLIVPLDGNLVVGMGIIVAEAGQQPQGLGSFAQNPSGDYAVSLAPEPGTMAILWLGLLGLAAYHRTRSSASMKKNSPHMTDSSTPKPLWTW